MAGPQPGPEPDPSMDDILASIRRILSEEEQAGVHPQANDVLDLDDSMLVTPPAPPVEPKMSEPADHQTIIAPEAEAQAATAMGSLRRTIEAQGAASGGESRALVAINRAGGPTLEDIVRDEMRPVLKAWLDAHLPPLVERLVAAEIERLVARSAS